MRYDHGRDELILKELEIHDRLSFADLRRVAKITDKKNRKNNLLARHLARLVSARIIEPDVLSDKGKEWKNGMKRYYLLTDAARMEKSLGIFEGVSSKRESRKIQPEDTKELKNRKLMQLLFFIGQVGGGRMAPAKEAQPGNIILPDKTGKLVPHSSSRLEGFGMSDFSNDVNLWMSTQAGAFAYLTFSKSELETSFNKLLSIDPPLIKAIGEYEGETRYGLADKSLGQFIVDCWILFTAVLGAIRVKWKNKLGKPSTHEMNWHRFFYGADGTRKFHQMLTQDYQKEMADFLASYPKFNTRALTREKRKQASESYLTQLTMAREIHQKLVNDHSNTIAKYKPFTTEFLKEVYPPFLQE